MGSASSIPKKYLVLDTIDRKSARALAKDKNLNFKQEILPIWNTLCTPQSKKKTITRMQLLWASHQFAEEVSLDEEQIPTVRELVSAMGIDGADVLSGFSALLETFLSMGGDVNTRIKGEDLSTDNATFEGTDFTLLMASASPKIRAPKCMQFLQSKKGKITLVNSNGYNTVDYAFDSKDDCEDPSLLEMLRKTKTGKAIVRSTEIKRTTIRVIDQFYKGDDAFELRQKFKSFMVKGLHDENGVPDEKVPAKTMKDFYIDMKVVPFSDFVGRPQGIPSGEDGLGVKLSDLPDTAYVMYFSQRWLQPNKDPMLANPDNNNQIKYAQIMKMVKVIAARDQLPEQDIYLWIDFSCISQSHETEKMQGIQSIPFYIGQCDYFVSMADTEYWHRAWCRLETIFASKIGVAWNVFKHGTVQEVNWRDAVEYLHLDPNLGHMTLDEDKPRIAQLTLISKHHMQCEVEGADHRQRRMSSAMMEEADGPSRPGSASSVQGPVVPGPEA
jgi:hypothetical protein